MKKKLTAVALVVCMIAIMLVGASLAYFTDETKAVENTMTLGSVEIVQYEKDKAGEAFVQDQPLFPMVDNRKENAPVVEEGFFNAAMANVIDKVITVENTGKSAAYVRTIIAFETAKVYAEGSTTEYKDAHDEYIGVLGDFEYLNETITIEGVEYTLAVKVYGEALIPEAETEPSLKQFFLAPTAGNEVADLFGETYTILALSQAVQTEGFADAETALNTAFGEITAESAAEWFAK